MAKETKYVCQVYRKNKHGQLVIDETIECRNEVSTEMRAEKIWESGTCEGVDAVILAADADNGEYDDPVFITRLGNVPDSDGMD